MTTAERKKTEEFRGHNALIVDDAKPMRQLIRSMLIQFGFAQIFEADDGLDALEQLDKISVDVIICDWMMEPMDGLNFVKALRSHSEPRVKSLPLLMLTAVANENKVKLARDSGITEYLLKPVKTGTLSRRLHSMLSTPRPFIITKDYIGPDRRRRDTEHPYHGGRRLSDRLAMIASDDDKIIARQSGVDYRKVIEQDAEKLQSLLAECKAEPSDLEQWKQIQRIAHNIKGQAPSFGFHASGAVATSLDKLIKPVLYHPDKLEFASRRRIKSAETHYQAMMMLLAEDIRKMSPEITALLERLSRTIKRVENDVRLKVSD